MMKKNYKNGFSLIEILIGVGILGFIVLGISSSLVTLVQTRNSVVNKTSYELMQHSYFKKIRYGVENILLNHIDPETSYYLKIKDESIKAEQVRNQVFDPLNSRMELAFGTAENIKLKVNNWTFLKYLVDPATGEKTSKKLEVIFSRCITQNDFKNVGQNDLKRKYKTKVYPVNISGEVKCCKFEKQGEEEVSATCEKLSSELLPSAWSMIVEKNTVSSNYTLSTFNQFLNVADMNVTYALGFNGNFLIDGAAHPISAEIDFYSHKNLCKTSSNPAKSCEKIKAFSKETLESNLKKKEFYENIRLKSVKWLVNVYPTLLDSGNAVVY